MASEDVLQARVRQSDKLSKYITLSTAHMTQADSVILKKLSRPYRDRHDESKWIDEAWVFDTQYGFILQLSQRDKRLATLRDEGGQPHFVSCLKHSQKTPVSLSFFFIAIKY